jgi:hypothetical protein
LHASIREEIVYITLLDGDALFATICVHLIYILFLDKALENVTYSFKIAGDFNGVIFEIELVFDGESVIDRDHLLASVGFAHCRLPQ